jgi:hypothetical protein
MKLAIRFGDVARMEVLDADGNSIFGAIEQHVVKTEQKSVDEK